jgi:AraC-like DNA-binding protein
MGELRRTTRRKSYERSALQNVDIDSARARLDELMRDERLYLDEELSLDSLGAELHLSRHQLSQLLNERIGKNFNEYLNEFRVRDACRMLIEEPERSVLSIAHAVGFNSKSSFHTAFRKFTGRTPLQFRAERRLLSA